MSESRQSVDRILLRVAGGIGGALVFGLLPFALQKFGSYGTARYLMGFGLIVLWVIVGGSLMRRHQAALARFMVGYDRRWRTAFLVFSTLLACIEEAIACLMTNLGGVFGDPTGTAYITASGNYLDLVFRHSVVVIVPMLAAWVWLFGRFRFSATRAFLLFGGQGALAEIIFTGMAPALFPVWLYVYGLMIWLPAQAFGPAAERSNRRREPRVAGHLLALMLPLLVGFVSTALYLTITGGLFGPHPPSHFPPPIE